MPPTDRVRGLNQRSFWISFMWALLLYVLASVIAVYAHNDDLPAWCLAVMTQLASLLWLYLATDS